MVVDGYYTAWGSRAIYRVTRIKVDTRGMPVARIVVCPKLDDWCYLPGGTIYHHCRVKLKYIKPWVDDALTRIGERYEKRLELLR